MEDAREHRGVLEHGGEDDEEDGRAADEDGVHLGGEAGGGGVGRLKEEGG